MVARSPALLSLGLAAFLRSLLPAQPAPCPHGAGARAAFRKPSCISPARRLREGPLGPAWPPAPTRLFQVGRLKGFGRCGGGSEALQPEAPGRSRRHRAKRVGGWSSRGPQTLPPCRSSRGHRVREVSAARVRGSGPQRRLAQGSRWVGGWRAQLSDLTPTLAPPLQSSGRTPGLDSRTNFPAEKGREGLGAGGWGCTVQTLSRHQPGRSGDPEALPSAAAS